MRSILFVIGLVLVTAACRSKSDPSPPHLPSGVPQSAVWLGGSKGGAFIHCIEVSKVPPTYRCDVFNDYTGDIRGTGYYRLVDVGVSQFNPSSPASYEAYYDDEIRLKAGALKVVEPPRPVGVPPIARWGGGAACGAFVACRPQQEASTLECQVYDQYSGALVLSGQFAPAGGRAARLEEIDGRCPTSSSIHLRNGEHLGKVDTQPEPR
jgi:hypothetical protein